MAYDKVIPQAPLPISMLPEANTLADNDELLVTQPNASQRSKKLLIYRLAAKVLASVKVKPIHDEFLANDRMLIVTDTGSPDSVATGLVSNTPGTLYDKIMEQATPTLDTRYLREVQFGDANGSSFTMGTQSSSLPSRYELLTGRKDSQAPTAGLLVPPGWVLDVSVEMHVSSGLSLPWSFEWCVAANQSSAQIGALNSFADADLDPSDVSRYYTRKVWKNSTSAQQWVIPCFEYTGAISSGAPSVRGKCTYTILPGAV